MQICETGFHASITPTQQEPHTPLTVHRHENGNITHLILHTVLSYMW